MDSTPAVVATSLCLCQAEIWVRSVRAWDRFSRNDRRVPDLPVQSGESLVGLRSIPSELYWEERVGLCDRYGRGIARVSRANDLKRLSGRRG